MKTFTKTKKAKSGIIYPQSKSEFLKNIIFFGIFFILSVVGVVVISIRIATFFNCPTTKATISEIEYKVKDTKNVTVYIDYSVNLVEYNHKEYNQYDPSMKEEQEIIIRYDSNDPNIIIYNNITGDIIGLSLASIVFIVSTTCISLMSKNYLALSRAEKLENI